MNKQNIKINKENQNINLNANIKAVKNICTNMCPDKILANKRIPKLKGLIKNDINSIKNKKKAKSAFIFF